MIKIYYLHQGDNIPFYVGKTSSTLNKRVPQHKLKFGLNIKIEELDVVENNSWKFWESYWIEQFRQWGFKLKNKNKGGGGTNNHSEITKSKIRKKWLEKSSKEKEIINNKRREGNIGKAKPNAGRKKFTSEQIEKAKIYSRFSNSDWSDKCKKPILMLNKITGETIQEFQSVTEAANYIGVTQPTLSGCLIGRTKTAGGYKWKYKNSLLP